MHILVYEYNVCDMYGIRLTGRISYHTRVCGSDKNGWIEKDSIDQNVIYIIFVYWDVFVEDDIFRFLSRFLFSTSIFLVLVYAIGLLDVFT